MNKSPRAAAVDFPGSILLAAVAIIALVGWAYRPSLKAPFIFDDRPAILENPTLHRLWPIQDVLFPPLEHVNGSSGRPLVSLSLALNYAGSKLDPRGYHLTNLVIHILAALTLFGVVRRAALGTEARPRATLVAFGVALIWATHPLLTESVTCVIQRNESMMGLFYLLTLYGFIRSNESGVAVDLRATANGAEGGPTVARRSTATSWQVLSVLACLLGMATKEVMATAPIVVFLYDRTFVAGSFAGAWRRRRKYYFALAATWIVLALLLVRSGGTRGHAAGFGVGLSPMAYAVTQGWAIAHYLRLAVWPHPLILDYGTVLVGLSQAWPYLLLVGGLVAATGWALVHPSWDRAGRLGPPRPTGGPSQAALPLSETLARSATESTRSGSRKAFVLRPALGFAGAWFFLILAPSSSIVPLAAQTVAEHRMYLPLVAVVALFVWALDRWLGRRALAVYLVLAAVLAGATLRRNQVYGTETSIWQDTVKHWPHSPRALVGLGLARAKAGFNEEAVGDYEAALRLEPNYADAYSDLGTALRQLGRYAEAIDCFRRALDLRPNYAEVRNNLGETLVASGQPAAAVAPLREALRLNPDFPEAEYNLGNALRDLGRFDEAIGHFQNAVRLDPDYADAHNNLGMVLGNRGRVSEALSQLEIAIRLKPDDADAHENLGKVLVFLGRTAEGEAHLREARRLRKAGK